MMPGEFDKHRTPEQEFVTTGTPSGAAPRQRAVSHGLSKYFAAALERLDYLEYGDPAEYLQRTLGIEFSNSPLQSIWVPPRFKQQEDSGSEVVLDTLLADPSPSILVLADPGCGKSTLARFLTCFFINRYCRSQQDYFGLLVPLSTIRLSGMTYHEAAVHCAAKYVGLEADEQVIQDLKAHLGQACAVFDGLDELPIVRRNFHEDDPVPLRQDAAALIRMLRYVETPRGDSDVPFKAIVTSRSKDYFEDKESALGAIPRYFISKFSPEQMNNAVRQWHEAAKTRAAEGKSEASPLIETLDERCRAIQSALRQYPELATVCLTPLMLSVLQTVYSDAKDLPSSVSQLCWRAISWFLVDKHIGTTQDSFVAEHGSWLLEAITELGWHVQKRVAAGKSKSFNDHDLRQLVQSSSTVKGFSRADYVTQQDAVTRMVSFLRRGHGILVRVADDEFDFVHNVFREVLAGRALSRLPMSQRRELALTELWSGPIRYWAGLRATERDGLYEICAFVGELSSDVRSGDVQAALARGEMLVEVCSIVPAERFTRDLKGQIAEVRKELSNLLERQDVRIAQRIRIGDLLGVLGDPLLEGPLLERVEWIAAGNRTIGRAENHRTRIPKYQTCPASPQQRGDLEAFGVSKYLVTNADFAEFIRAAGYTTRRYWPNEVAWKWSSGDQATIRTLVEKARSVAPTHLSSELAGQRLVPDEIPELCVQMVQRRRPLYWLDPAHNRPNQPVVGINWWEAVAYCSWLDQELRSKKLLNAEQLVRLPIEAEWETAARLCGAAGVYPWIDGEPCDCAHVRAAFHKHTDQPIFRSCAVGLFRCVKTNLAIYDLVGNVWEWTASQAKPYGASSFAQKIILDGLDDRIARGSSWLSSEEESTQVTFRSFDPPYNAYEDLGFRIVIGRNTDR
jgi:formylglycine-generating enzyme required for sulfatase activity